ncbi:MAG: AAA family ATPase, partial [Ktedonobacteraceae bacterium]
MSNKVTYRQQFTRCGKERCRKCRDGLGHGPYWYAYWSESGRTVSKYIGIHPPQDVELELQQPAKTDEPRNVPQQSSTQTLRIYVLGQFRIDRLEGNERVPVATRTWYRRRPRALLGCLLSSVGRRIGREQAMDALWPDLDIETAANRLNGAVHELRQILEPEIARPAASLLLRSERDILELADRSKIWVDADVFESLLNESHNVADDEQIERILEQAADLYGGDYLLEELYSEWAAPRREALRRGWISLLLKLAELREARGHLVNAMEPLNRLLATDPTDETAVQRLMILLTRLDRRGEALSTYRRLATRLQRNYESEPLPETRELFESLQKGSSNKSPAVAHKNKTETPSVPTEKPDIPEVSVTLSHETSEVSSDTNTLDIPATGKAVARTLPIYVSSSQFGRNNQSPLVGRTKELETIRQILLSIEEKSREEHTIEHIPEAARSQSYKPELPSPHFILLMGETGIGKTRLAEELSHAANGRGWSVAWSRAYEQEGAVPYRPWVELLRTLLQHVSLDELIANMGPKASDKSAAVMQYAPTMLERLSALLPELREYLPQASKVYPPLPPEQERLHLWEATLALLSGLSKTTPLLLVLDDLHWTDGSSHELLAYITRHLQEQRILFIGTCRDVELAATHSLRHLITDLRREQAIVTVPVQPLTPSQIGSLVAYLPQNIIQSIQSQAAGNPFFAEELARVSETTLQPLLSSEVQLLGMTKGTALRNDENSRERELRAGSVSSLPEGIAAVLDRRLGKLSDECQQLLGKAAVMGGSFEFRQLLYMANEYSEDTLLDLLEEALRAGLLTEEGAGARITYHFWHPLIISHLYERLSAARCAQLHRRAANSLLHMYAGTEGKVAANITYHLTKGGGESAQIALYAEIAAHQAFSLAAYSEAEQYYWQAIQTLTHNVLLQEDRVDETTPVKLAQVPTGTFDVLHVARLLERICECCNVQGNYEEARGIYICILELRKQLQAQMSECERKREAQIQALIMREIGRTWVSTSDYEQADEWYKRGKQVLADAEVTSGAAWACLHLQQGTWLRIEGLYDEARRYTNEALEMLEQAMQENGVPRIEQATSSVEAAKIRILQTIPDQTTLQVARSNNAVVSSLHFETCTERAIEGDPLEVGRAHELLGIIAASVGHLTDALNHMYIALSIFEQHGLIIAMVQLCSNLGVAHASRSENAVASTYLHRSLDLAERMGNLPIMSLAIGNLGEMASRTGNLLEAEEWFRRSIAISERTNEREHTSWCNVSLATALQDQGNLQSAAESVRKALMIARTIKSARCTGAALVALADLRTTQAIFICHLREGVSHESVPLPSAA